MSEAVKKSDQIPESYSPKERPEIIKIAEAVSSVSINGEIIPFLFKKDMIHLSKAILVGKQVTYPVAKQGIKGEDANPPLSLLWDECKKDGTFSYLDHQKDSIRLEAHLGLYYDINKNGNFSYLVGVLMKEDVTVPEGFAGHEIPATDVAVCWYKYKDGDDIWSVAHGTVEKYMTEQGYEGNPESGWCSELYAFADEAYKAETGYNILGYLIACRKKGEAK